jgi:hypothetical protein
LKFLELQISSTFRLLPARRWHRFKRKHLSEGGRQIKKGINFRLNVYRCGVRERNRGQLSKSSRKRWNNQIKSIRVKRRKNVISSSSLGEKLKFIRE